MPNYSHLPALLLIAGLVSCTTTAPLQCRHNEQALVSSTLYFGTGKTKGVVTNKEWLGFLADIVTPRFPQGLTVIDASGQWRSVDGQIVREAAHALTLVHPGDAASDRAIDEIIARYKSSFAQESVLSTRSPTCVSF
jgi:Protein of unknown function (DUF3574)